MEEHTQQQIIRGCQKGKSRFQRVLVERYSGLLMGVVKRYITDPDQSKDVLQEALIRILDSIKKYKDTGSFEGWLKKVTVNTCLRYLEKKHHKHELHIIEDTPEPITDPSIYSQLNEHELFALIQSLPDTYRTVFNLHAIEGYSHQEISSMLNINESTSRAQLTRARALLKASLLSLEPNSIKV